MLLTHCCLICKCSVYMYSITITLLHSSMPCSHVTYQSSTCPSCIIECLCWTCATGVYPSCLSAPLPLRSITWPALTMYLGCSPTTVHILDGLSTRIFVVTPFEQYGQEAFVNGLVSGYLCYCLCVSMVCVCVCVWQCVCMCSGSSRLQYTLLQ